MFPEMVRCRAIFTILNFSWLTSGNRFLVRTLITFCSLVHLLEVGFLSYSCYLARFALIALSEFRKMFKRQKETINGH